MSTLLVGFDSAWTAPNSGAIVGLFQFDNLSLRSLGEPRIANFREAESVILKWQGEWRPTTTIVMIDQPTIVKNHVGQRPVENLVGSLVSLRYGGMQPANTARQEMFGEKAPVWPFLARFGGPADPLAAIQDTRVFETYPTLALIALGWVMQDSRRSGRLPKYNPDRRKTFSISDWQYVCRRVDGLYHGRGLPEIEGWIAAAARKTSPRKHDQDCLDACVCLLIALCMAEGKDCLMVGNAETGYIVVAHSGELYTELCARCEKTGRVASEWVQQFRGKFVGSSNNPP